MATGMLLHTSNQPVPSGASDLSTALYDLWLYALQCSEGTGSVQYTPFCSRSIICRCGLSSGMHPFGASIVGMKPRFCSMNAPTMAAQKMRLHREPDTPS